MFDLYTYVNGVAYSSDDFGFSIELSHTAGWIWGRVGRSVGTKTEDFKKLKVQYNLNVLQQQLNLISAWKAYY